MTLWLIAAAAASYLLVGFIFVSWFLTGLMFKTSPSRMGISQYKGMYRNMFNERGGAISFGLFVVGWLPLTIFFLIGNFAMCVIGKFLI